MGIMEKPSLYKFIPCDGTSIGEKGAYCANRASLVLVLTETRGRVNDDRSRQGIGVARDLIESCVNCLFKIAPRSWAEKVMPFVPTTTGQHRGSAWIPGAHIDWGSVDGRNRRPGARSTWKELSPRTAGLYGDLLKKLGSSAMFRMSSVVGAVMSAALGVALAAGPAHADTPTQGEESRGGDTGSGGTATTYEQREVVRESHVVRSTSASGEDAESAESVENIESSVDFSAIEEAFGFLLDGFSGTE